MLISRVHNGKRARSSMKSPKKTSSRKTIENFLKFGKNLIPLNRAHGKRPLHSDWPNRKYTKKEIIRYAEKGFNIGYRIGDRQLVIDIDPRNNGKEGLAQLREDFKLHKIDNIFAQYPTVKTGGNGYHIYMRLRSNHVIDPDFPKKRLKIRETVDRYPGVEFKVLGRQVVIPGSIHPETKKRYRFLKQSPYKKREDYIPIWLIRALQVRPTFERYHNQKLTNKELKFILDQLPVTEYETNELWFPILAASFHSTRGKGLQIFTKWSIQDPRYADQAETVSNRWNSLQSRTPNPRTVGTLFRELFKHGGELPGTLSIEDEFAEEFDKEEIDDTDLFGFDEVQPNTTKLKSLISELSGRSNQKTILKVLRRVYHLDYLQQSLYIRDIANNTGIPRGDLRKTLDIMKGTTKGKAVRIGEDDETLIEDLAQQIVSELLDTQFKGGKTLIHSRDQRYWSYNSRFWEEKPPNMIDKEVYRACVRYRAKNPTIDFTTSNTMAQAERVLRARTATMQDLFRLEEEPRSVINVANGELWIDGEKGNWELKKHSSKSYLLNCLENVKYDPSANCKIFDRTLSQIFAKERDRADMVRHLWELFGYCLQPRKNIPSWWLFYGRGANGKTLVLRVLSALLGDTVLEHRIGDFDTGKNTHSFADLPGKLVLIDEDVRSNTVLPDDFLKKVSENKILLANPKFKIPFRFRCTVTPILACNSVPITRDLSTGMMRRAFVIPFRRQFTEAEQDLNRDKRIIEKELSGILNKALIGLERLRRRGNFREPIPCTRAKRAWMHESNPILGFLADCCEKEPGKRTSIRKIWDVYSDWCDDLEIEYRYRLSVRSLTRTLIEMGFDRARTRTGTKAIRGLRLVVANEDDDLIGD